MSRNVHYEGYIVLNYDEGVIPIEIVKEDGFVSVWTGIDAVYRDDIENVEDLAADGNLFYDTLEDYRNNNNPRSLEDVWPE